MPRGPTELGTNADHDRTLPAPAAPAASTAPSFPPTQFDGYRLECELGRGAMGEVYLAYDTKLDRHVAIKFMRFPSDAYKHRFRTEAKAAAALQHPNVVTVHMVGELLGNPYIVSEYIRGQSLDELAKPAPWRQVYQIALDLARGLAAAHRHDVLHRDIKPGNAVLSDAGVAKLIDFGVAKRVNQLSPAELSPDAKPDSDHANAEPLAPAQADNSTPSSVHTVPGALVGTLAYMAPEIREEYEEATPRTDIYSFGAMLYELCSGHPPPYGVPVPPIAARSDGDDNDDSAANNAANSADNSADDGDHNSADAAPDPAAETAAGADHAAAVRDSQERRAPVEPAFEALIHRCLARDPEQRFSSADELREALEDLAALATPQQPPVLPAGNPYRGFLPFEAQHQGLFCGRDAQSRLVIDRLGGQSFVLVAGQSGVGKSSLVRAGVLPRVEAGALGDGRTWSTHILLPGRDPLTSVVQWLAELLDIDEHKLRREIEISGVAALRHRLRQHHHRDRGTLLFVDQLEELVTVATVRDPLGRTREYSATINETMSDQDRAARDRWRAERDRACELLTQLAERTPGMRLIGTVRTDCVDRIAALPALGPLVERALCILRPLDRQALRETIVEPARITGVEFESDELIDRLAEAASEAEGGLPLLQFALAQLWEARDQQRALITEAAFERVGGVEGALARHADGVFDEMLASSRASAKHILLRLVSSHGTNLRCRSDELLLSRHDPRALEALVKGRLVVAAEIDGASAYQLAHEALIDAWPRLRSWLDEQPQRDATLRRLQANVAAWQQSGRSSEFLWGPQQIAASRILDHARLTPEEKAFLRASERGVRNARWRKHLAWMTIALVLGASYGLHRINTARAVSEHLSAAKRSLQHASDLHARYRESRESTFELLRANQPETAAPLWRDTLARIPTVIDSYGRANREVELALGLAPAQDEIRSVLGEILHQRAELADMTGRRDERDQLLERLAIYAPSRHQRWTAAVPVSIHSAPSGARVYISEYEQPLSGPWTEHAVDDSGSEAAALTPLTRTLAPGSYVVTIPGDDVFAETRYPLLIAPRSQPISVTIARVAAADIPPGFLYIPAGDYLAGYGERSSQEDIRIWYEAPPLHRRTTGPYLIAKHETTIGEWIEYLEALPPAAPRPMLATDKAMTGTSGAKIRLAKRDDGRWQLQFAPEDKDIYEAVGGEPFQYPGRQASYRWERFPISGISWNEAQAYVAWLRESGAVKRARLCRPDEWERAARGADRRRFPHGAELLPDDANFDRTYGRKPTAYGPDPVGSHPLSASPFGVHDMAGNVWELLAHVAAPLPGPEHHAPAVAEGGANVAFGTGGSYYQDRADASIYNRQIVSVDWHDIRIGLRVCADIDIDNDIDVAPSRR